MTEWCADWPELPPLQDCRRLELHEPHGWTNDSEFTRWCDGGWEDYFAHLEASAS